MRGGVRPLGHLLRYHSNIPDKYGRSQNSANMPLTKTPKKRQPIWKRADELAQKSGLRHAVYGTNGEVYVGEWSNNKKCG